MLIGTSQWNVRWAIFFVSIPDRDSCWLELITPAEFIRPKMFQSLIGIHVDWNSIDPRYQDYDQYVSIPDRDSCWLEPSVTFGGASFDLVSIPDRDSCWLEPQAAFFIDSPYPVSIPDRDSCWLEHPLTLKPGVNGFVVSIPDRDSCWLEPLTSK